MAWSQENLIFKLFMFFALQLNFYFYIIIFCNRTSQEDHLKKSRTQQIQDDIYRFNIIAYYFFLFRDVSLLLKVKVIDQTIPKPYLFSHDQDFFGIFYMNRTLKSHSKGAIRKQIFETY